MGQELDSNSWEEDLQHDMTKVMMQEYDKFVAIFIIDHRLSQDRK